MRCTPPAALVCSPESRHLAVGKMGEAGSSLNMLVRVLTNTDDRYNHLVQMYNYSGIPLNGHH